ncbi:MAG: methyltransferase domain-containing protein [Sphingomonas sp.]|uniref:class I SAM-dependent methyltransferase n=1 Tax=Sphingomonas sp. TaxID=28214 RepID=UPI001AC49E3C|nr:class I SAM-dependent methyltransferase [Sphingomonas sp.]MBN8808849.1 methyltransferase domain-containing protein [Sphingomonas sp.]
MEVEKSWETGMLGYGDVLKGIVASYPHAGVLELGAGRRPSFTLEEMPSSIRSYTVNDISAEELALLPEGYDAARFDVSGDASNFRDQYDVVFSRFLAEHVADGEAMHRNVYQVLREGGAAFHLIPTLYAVPFVINKFLPERLTSWVLAKFAPRRAINPKFPAYYSMCYGNPDKMARKLTEIGYKKVEIRNFYGHFYYEKIPVLRSVHRWFSDLAARREWTSLSSYAYIKAYK